MYEICVHANSLTICAYALSYIGIQTYIYAYLYVKLLYN